jgi:hypothetical protein
MYTAVTPGAQKQKEREKANMTGYRTNASQPSYGQSTSDVL